MLDAECGGGREGLVCFENEAPAFRALKGTRDAAFGAVGGGNKDGRCSWMVVE